MGEIADRLKRAKNLILTDFTGLNVELSRELRSSLRTSGVDFLVVKNTLIRRAAQDVGLEELGEHLGGPTALAIFYDDSTLPAKVISDFVKKNQMPKVRVCYFGGRFYGPDFLNQIASIPPREVLLGQLVGGLGAPIKGLAFRLSGLLQKWVGVLEALRRQKEQKTEVRA